MTIRLKLQKSSGVQFSQKMTQLLDLMDRWDDSAIRTMAGIPAEDNSAEALALIDKECQNAKDRFFFLFGKWFYDL